MRPCQGQWHDGRGRGTRQALNRRSDPMQQHAVIPAGACRLRSAAYTGSAAGGGWQASRACMHAVVEFVTSLQGSSQECLTGGDIIQGPIASWAANTWQHGSVLGPAIVRLPGLSPLTATQLTSTPQALSPRSCAFAQECLPSVCRRRAQQRTLARAHMYVCNHAQEHGIPHRPSPGLLSP